MNRNPTQTLIPTVCHWASVLLLSALVLMPQARAEGFEDIISAITRPSLNQKVFFAVIDVKTNTPVEAVAEAARDGVKRYATAANLAYKLPPATNPTRAGRMRPVSYGQRQAVQCSDDVADIVAKDTSFAKYGEATATVVCIFPYRGGYQVDLFASFFQATGGTSPHVLGAMLGRLFTNAVGLGDSSSFVGKTIAAIEEKLSDAGMQPRIVELFPAIGGLQVDRDAASTDAASSAGAGTSDAPAGASTQAVAAPQTGNGAAPLGSNVTPVAYASAASTDGGNFDEAARTMAEVSQRIAAIRAQYAVRAANSDPVEARKALTAMGLTYYDQNQFIAAIKRSDAVAVRLFIAGQGVDISRPDADGVTPLHAAESLGNPNGEVVTLLQRGGSR